MFDQVLLFNFENIIQFDNFFTKTCSIYHNDFKDNVEVSII